MQEAAQIVADAPHEVNYTPEFRARFWPKVNKTDGCWLWTAFIHKVGYGQIGCDGKILYAHRVAWELANGAVPDGLCVLHKCDVRACCRADHLFLGTKTDNMIDKVSKGRQQRGIDFPQSKLTEATVRQIRELHAIGRSQGSLAREFGISQATLNSAVNRKTWKHVI